MTAEGVALILGAVGLLLTTLGTFIVSMVTLSRQGRVESKVQDLAHAVNGQSKELKDEIRKVALIEGKVAGVAQERANPMEPKKL